MGSPSKRLCMASTSDDDLLQPQGSVGCTRTSSLFKIRSLSTSGHGLQSDNIHHGVTELAIVLVLQLGCCDFFSIFVMMALLM